MHLPINIGELHDLEPLHLGRLDSTLVLVALAKDGEGALPLDSTPLAFPLLDIPSLHH